MRSQNTFSGCKTYCNIDQKGKFKETLLLLLKYYCKVYTIDQSNYIAIDKMINKYLELYLGMFENTFRTKITYNSCFTRYIYIIFKDIKVGIVIISCVIQ